MGEGHEAGTRRYVMGLEPGLDTKMGCVGHLWRTSLSIVMLACGPQGPKAVHLKSCSSRDLRILPK